MQKFKSVIFAALILGGAAIPSGAQQPAASPPPTTPYGPPITLEAAKKVMAAAETEAVKNEWSMAIVILDSTSHIVICDVTAAVARAGITHVRYITPANAFMIAYGGKGLVTPDGKLHTEDPQVRAAAVKAIERLTTPFKEGYVPPSCVNWNDADDNNAFHSKLMVMDFDGTISTEVAIYDKKAEYDDIVTRGLPLGNDGKELPAQVIVGSPVIPKGAKNVAMAKEFLKYAVQPKVLNEYLKGGLGRWMIPVPEIAKTDPFWLKEDLHRKAYTELTLLAPTLPIYEVYNPAIAQVNAEHLFSVAEFEVMNNGMAPEQAIEKAFKRMEEIFARYPIAQT